MKIKVLDYYIINKSKSNKKIILDVKIIESERNGLLNKKFSSDDKDLSFIVLSVGHLKPPIENFYLITVKVEDNSKLEKYKNCVFTDNPDNE